MAEMKWREAIIQVLSEAERPLHYAEISERIASQRLRTALGATPDSTVNAQITASLKHEGERSPFLKTERSIYTLKPQCHVVLSPTTTHRVDTAATPTADLIEPDDAMIRCLGIYWQRDLVIWRNEPRIFGKQQALSKSVDFSGQRGIYLLYDHHTAVYVGRSVDRPLGKRLYEHTIDRLGSRWNRFSWFGLLDVTDDGALIEVQPSVTLSSMIATLEALLIETLEPPLNRKRGDDFSVREYIQDRDPELEEREIQNTLRAIEKRLRN